MEYRTGTYCDFFCSYGKIYSLSDVNGNVFYIGCTVYPMEQRLKQHVSEARSDRKTSNQRKNRVIKESGFEVTATILEIIYVTGRKSIYAQKRLVPFEKKWIKKYLSLGYDLTNARPKKEIKTNAVKELVGQSFSISRDKIIVEEVTNSY